MDRESFLSEWRVSDWYLSRTHDEGVWIHRKWCHVWSGSDQSGRVQMKAGFQVMVELQTNQAWFLWTLVAASVIRVADKAAEHRLDEAKCCYLETLLILHLQDRLISSGCSTPQMETLTCWITMVTDPLGLRPKVISQSGLNWAEFWDTSEVRNIFRIFILNDWKQTSWKVEMLLKSRSRRVQGEVFIQAAPACQSSALWEADAPRRGGHGHGVTLYRAAHRSYSSWRRGRMELLSAAASARKSTWKDGNPDCLEKRLMAEIWL